MSLPQAKRPRVSDGQAPSRLGLASAGSGAGTSDSGLPGDGGEGTGGLWQQWETGTRQKVAGVLRKLLRDKSSSLFRDPVPLHTPDYYQEVKQPMDLNTLSTRLRSGEHYANPNAVAADIALIFANCRQYNEGDAKTEAITAECEEVFLGLWATAGLPAPGAAQPWQRRGASVLRQMLQLDAAVDFTAPVPAGIRGYKAVVSHPMDLGTVHKTLRRGGYTFWEEVRSFED